jgi:DNA-binding transcriptional MerR regulator
MSSIGFMRIGELARTAGTTTRALRYYEAQGLLRAHRRSNGYRDYDQSHLRLVREIQALQAVGFALEDTRPFVECLLAGNATGDSCPASVAVYRRKLAEVDACLARLGEVRAELVAKLARATDTGEGTCPHRSP